VSLAFAAARSRLGAVRSHRLRFARRAPLVGAVLAALAGCTDLLPLGTVTVSPTAAALCVGDSVAFTADVRDEHGGAVASPQLSWSSSAPQIVSIDPVRGVAHALATGSAQITASSRGARSLPAALDVPADLLPEFVPDSLVLAPGDTMTLGVRLRRASSGPVPSHAPAITPASTRVAAIDASGLVTAKDTGRAGFSVGACGQTGGGAVDVFVPADSLTGASYLWLSGAAQVRVRLPAQAIDFTRTNGQPAFQVSGLVGPALNPSRAFLYEDTVALAGIGTYALDSLKSTDVTSSLACQPPRPFALYTDQAAVTLLFGLRGAAAEITTYTTQAPRSVSGRMIFRVRGSVNGQLGPGGGPDTLAAVYTFSVPLVSEGSVCP